MGPTMTQINLIKLTLASHVARSQQRKCNQWVQTLDVTVYVASITVTSFAH